MQRARRSAALLISTLLAMAIAFVAAAPASAAPSPSHGNSNAVIFVHGFDPDGPADTDCTEYWSNARQHFRDKGWSGTLATFGYYSAGDNCTWKYNGARGTSITTVAKALATYIFEIYTRDNKKVDVVAHSMGGLVIRSALYHVRNGTPGFPSRLYVEDVVTLGTPHDGADSTQINLCKLNFPGQKQCSQMAAGSDFLANLPEEPSTSAMRTHWSAVSSYADTTVGGVSGVGINADLKIQYHANGGISHSGLKDLRSGTFAKRVWDKNYPGWSAWTGGIPPLQTAYLEAYWAGL